MTKGAIRDQQLAHVIAGELDAILGGADNPMLSEFSVSDVIPKRGGAHFVVLLVPSDNILHLAAQYTECITRASSFLRSELAESLSLKRMPELTIQLDPRWSVVSG